MEEKEIKKKDQKVEEKPDAKEKKNDQSQQDECLKYKKEILRLRKLLAEKNDQYDKVSSELENLEKEKEYYVDLEEAKTEDFGDDINYKEEIINLRNQLSEKQDQYIRVFAELENFRKRTEKENIDKLKFANQQIITSLLTVIDHLDMAISHITPQSSIESLQEGINLTLKEFYNILKKFGVEEIKVEVGDDFDPNLHEAMMLAHDPYVKNNKITMVLQKGFTLNDRVIRPAKVQVNKIEEEKNNKDIKEESNE